ncbi:hypothetical protein PoB_007372500 [Plakobranchus ocellatus]|uniref:Uncharacterized protein n=1 Tax=Plakobranchus ocellatus TaxID=259542 RepID=A0AAV4DT50_9GAST|nr:hypothetical protein PoB_007372500 [Plakobranchus ocellatus]
MLQSKHVNNIAISDPLQIASMSREERKEDKTSRAGDANPPGPPGLHAKEQRSKLGIPWRILIISQSRYITSELLYSVSSTLRGRRAVHQREVILYREGQTERDIIGIEVKDDDNNDGDDDDGGGGDDDDDDDADDDNDDDDDDGGGGSGGDMMLMISSIWRPQQRDSNQSFTAASMAAVLSTPSPRFCFHCDNSNVFREFIFLKHETEIL